MLCELRPMVTHYAIRHLVEIVIKHYQCWEFVKLFTLRMREQFKHDWKNVKLRIVRGGDGLVSGNKNKTSELNIHYVSVQPHWNNTFEKIDKQ